MKFKYIEKDILYDGTQLSAQFAYRNFNILGDSIISFQGGADVNLTHMVDIEDVLNKEPIYSPLMLHFIIEHFDNDLHKMVLRQRLLVAIIKESIEKLNTNITIIRSGDDLFYDNRKLTVSIATITPVSTVIHTAINIKTENTPIPTSGLNELQINPKDLSLLIMKSYTREMDSIWEARCKVRGVT